MTHDEFMQVVYDNTATGLQAKLIRDAAEKYYRSRNSGKPIGSRSGAITPYSAAWKWYTRSADYKNSVEILLSKGLVQPYIDNILRSAFDAGYNSKR